MKFILIRTEVIRNTVSKQIHRIFGPMKVQGVWRIQYKGELYTLYKDNYLVTYMHVKGLEWAGHVVRMFDNRIISYARRKSRRKKAC
jgi:hypothetical protein